MKLVIGLGNPGPEYREHRHNIGFRVVDEIAKRAGIALTDSRFRGVFGQGLWDGVALGLLKPETWMNASGEAVQAALEELALSPSELLVVLDDVDLPLGRLRLRSRGGDGGQRGLRSILHYTGEEVARLRFGVGRPAGGTQTRDHVLEPFSQQEQPQLEVALDRAVQAVSCWMQEGTTAAMNRFNGSPDEEI